MNWDTYITDLDIPDNWECTSFHHDELPSYEHNGYKIWIDSHDLHQRIENTKNIFGKDLYISEERKIVDGVDVTDDNLMPRFIVENDDLDECQLGTNDFKEVVHFVTSSINMKEEDLRQWFGNRGIELEEGKLTYKVVKKQGNRWLFILDDCFEYEGSDEVESYFLDTSYCEAYDGWKAKAFNWELENLLSLVDDHDGESE
jgi:hypothetical protein